MTSVQFCLLMSTLYILHSGVPKKLAQNVAIAWLLTGFGLALLGALK